MNAPAIQLGTSHECLKSGRYARLMGSFWRHPKAEKCGDAALGLFMRILSFCADQAVDVVSERRMVNLFRGSHGRRNLNELIAAGFIKPTPEGYVVHDWYEHNRVRKPGLKVIQGGRAPEPSTANLRRSYGEVKAKAPPEIIEEPPDSRARASTQDPGIKLKEGATPPPPPPPTGTFPKPVGEPKKARPKDERRATFRAQLDDIGKAHGLLTAGKLSITQLDAAVATAKQHAERTGMAFADACRLICSDAAVAVSTGRKSELCWAVKDWQPGEALRAAQRPYGAPPERRPNERPENCTDGPKARVVHTREEARAELARWAEKIRKVKGGR